MHPIFLNLISLGLFGPLHVKYCRKVRALEKGPLTVIPVYYSLLILMLIFDAF